MIVYSPLLLLALLLSAIASPARAEVVTLRCAFIEPGGPNPFTLDVDLDRRVVTSSLQTPHVSRADITDRYVYYINRVQRLDRVTGILGGLKANGEYGEFAHCERVPGVVF